MATPPLQASFRAASTALVVQESPRCEVVVTHEAAAPLDLPTELHPEWPTMRVKGPGPDDVVEVAPEERWGGRPPIPFRSGTGPVVQVAPGAGRPIVFDLLSRLDLPCAGVYEVSALVGAGGAVVESAPVRFDVAPVRPLAVTPAVAEAGVWSAAWVQDGEPPRLYVRTLALGRGQARTRRLVPVAEVPREARPVLSSAGPATADAGTPRRLVAWREGADLRWADASDDRGADAAVGELGLGRAVGDLVAPLAIEPGRRRALGVVLRDATVRPVWLGDEPAVGETAVDLGGRPAAVEVLVGSNGGAVVLAHVPADGAVQVRLLAWPPRGEPPAPRTVATCKGTFAAAAGAIDAEGWTRGATLTWFAKRPGEAPVPTLTRWTVDPSGAAKVEVPALWPWDRRWAIEEVSLRLDPAGAPHLLAREATLGWLHAAPLRTPAPALPEGAPCVGPLDLVFADGRALVLVHDPARGLGAHTPAGAQGVRA